MNPKKIITTIVVIIVGMALIYNGKTKTATLPPDYLDDRASFGKVNQLFIESMEMTKAPDNSGKPFDIPKDKQDLMLAKLSEGISLSSQIDDNFLDYLNPELKDKFRNFYVKGNELFYEGVKSNDTKNINSIGVKKQLEGNKLVGEWISWWDKNKDNITNKAFTK